MKLRSWISSLCVSAGLLSAPVYAQEGDALFKTYCAICHDAGGNSQAPNRDVLSRMSPEQILQVLEKGAMKAQAAARSGAYLRNTFPASRSRASQRSFPSRRSAAARAGRSALR